MPLFEYRCSECGKRTELMILAGDGKFDPACPACGSAKMNRLLSRFAAHGTHKSEESFDGLDKMPCGADECEAPEMCGTGACGYGDSDF